MRATRAYIAGFGTAGSLLAGAAILFVFASAVVSFQGWPHVAEQAQPLAVVPAHAPADSRAVRRLAALTGTRNTNSPTTTASHNPSGAAHHRTVGHHNAPVKPGSPTGPAKVHIPKLTPPHTTPVATPSTPPASAPSPPAPTCTGGACAVGTVTKTLGGVTAATTAGLGNTVANAGSTVGSLLGNVTGALGNKLGTGNPALGSTVRGTGAALGNTVTGATAGLGNTVAGAGKTLGGLLSGAGGQPSASR